MSEDADAVEREFDRDVRAFVDRWVAAEGARATEQRLQDRYGTNPEQYAEHQEALAYLRMAYEDQLMSDDNSHANAVHAQLRQAARDGDLPEEIAERHDLDTTDAGGEAVD